MFLGTTTKPVRDYMADEIKALKPRRMFEPFAGIFMVSQICGMVYPEMEVLSSDISMFSVEIGCGLAGIPTPVVPKPCLYEKFPGLAEYTSPIQRGAIMIFMSEVAVCARKAHVKYYATLLEDMTIRHVKYVNSIVAKMEKARQNLPKGFRFHPSDGVKLMEQAGEGDAVFYDPPFWSGGYEKMFEALADWYEPLVIPYTECNSDLKDQHLQDLADRGCHVYYRCEEPTEIPRYENVFKAEYKSNGWFLVYANAAKTMRLMRNDRMREKAPNYDVITPETVFTEKSRVQIVPVNTPTANHYRLMWTKKAEMQSMGTPFLITIDSLVAGVVVVDSGQSFGSSYARIISDVGCTATRYPRLAKLILASILTDEFLTRVNDAFIYPHEGFTTIAYSDAKVSMKYRGMFELAERKQGQPGGKAYELVYRTKKMRAKTIKAAYQQWWQKYSNERQTGNTEGES